MAKETKKQRAARLARARRNRFKGLNVVNAAETYAQLSIWSDAMLGVNPISFVTGVIPENASKKGGAYNPGADGGHTVTLPELAGFRKGGHSGELGGNYGSYADNALEAVARNLSGGYQTSKADVNVWTSLRGMIMPSIQSAAVGIGFNWGKKLTRTPRRKANELLKKVQLEKWIKF